ncbi:VirB4 family type IV secretion system protein [Desulfosarcina cetonica]
MTKKGTLLGAIEIDGRDPDGLNKDDFLAMSLISRSICLNLPDSVRGITQYYLHFNGSQVSLKPRSNPVSDYLSKSRERFLNGKIMSSTRIVYFFEIDPEENLTKQNPLTFLKHLMLAFRNKNSREIITRYLSSTETIMAYERDLRRQATELLDLLQEVKARWDTIFGARILTIEELWRYCRFFANLNPDFLACMPEAVPDEQWDVLLAEGDRQPVAVGNKEFIKFKNLDNVYARMISITRFGENKVSPGFWSSMAHSPTRQKGNFIIMNRFLPISKIRQGLIFGEKKRELKRSNLSFGDLFQLFGNKGPASGDRYADLKPAIREKMLEIEKAETLEDRWGRAQASVLIFDSAPDRVNQTAKNLIKSINQVGLSGVSESIGLIDAYRAFLPAGAEHSIRNTEMNSTQYGAASLVYRSSEGQITVEDLGHEEAQYIFTCPDGSLYHFSPFVGGRGVVICVGPVRSGKSFTKNSLQSHFVKYGGLYRAIDIDPGSETLAAFFRQDGATFRIGQGNRGFNSFAVAGGPDDNHFVMHQKQMVMEMLKSNDSEELQRLDIHEQQQLDQAIIEALKLPLRLRRFSSMVNLCPRELKQKLDRWHGGGMFAGLFDQEQDAIGSLDKPVAAFNLAGVKDNPALLPLAMSEITYRVTRMFENPDYRSVPKFLDIDEAHALLRIGYMRDYIVRSVRTWGKWKAGIGLWSQDPLEFYRLDDWPVLRKAASTFFFMADPTADLAQYQSTFDLAPGEVEAIRNLRPKRDAYIIQRELGVSKTIMVEVEQEQYVISTSRPEEAVIRDRLIAENGIEEGIRKTVEALEDLNRINKAA